MRTSPWFPIGVVVALLSACGPASRNGSDDTPGDDAECSGSEKSCDGNGNLLKCDDGHFVVDQACPSACDPTLGCVVCVPNSTSCQDDDHARACAPDGQTYTDTVCDGSLGLVCAGGMCQNECDAAAASKSYVGCEYYPTVTGNVVDETTFHFAVSISNAGRGTANVTIDGGGIAPINLSVQPGDVAVQILPWRTELVSSSTLSAGAAYHLVSTVPVTVYQFNPLEYTSGGFLFSYTNDASLLLPVAAMQNEYVVASYPTNAAPGLMALTGTQDGTTVTIVPRGATSAGSGAPALTPGVPAMITLNKGDIVQFMGDFTAGNDLTGSIVTSDKPIQVIGGHQCSFVPSEVMYCDHLEESMFPTQTLSNNYVVSNPAVPPLPDGKEMVVRVIAVQADTHVTFDPPQPGVNTTLAAPGDFIDMPHHLGDFVVSSDHRVMVAQYMEGQDAGGNTGDPAVALAVATDQYRNKYLFHAPVNYEVSYVNITGTVGSAVNLDGQQIVIGHPIGGSGQGIERVQLAVTPTGNHSIEGQSTFGISVYGYGQYTSYWYPGGLNLIDIVIP